MDLEFAGLPSCLMLELLGRPFQSWPGRIAAAAVVLVGVIIGVVAGSGGGDDEVVVQVEATPTEAPTPTPSPEPTATPEPISWSTGGRTDTPSPANTRA